VKPELRVTARLVLSAKLLELNVVEIWDLLRSTLEKNPVLEFQGSRDLFAAPPRPSTDQLLQRLYDQSGDARLPLAPEDEEEVPREELWTAPEPGFWQRLDWQLDLHFPPHHPARSVAEGILNHLNEDGYLSLSLEELAQTLHVSPKTLEETRSYILRQFDPPGVASLDFREFWKVWMEAQDLQEHPFYGILDRLPEDEHEMRAFLEQAFPPGTPLYEDTATLIRLLPRTPASIYEREPVGYVVPDVVYRVIEGKLVVSVNEPWQGRLRLSPRYREIYEQRRADPETLQFLRKQFQEANELLDLLENRRNRLFRVAHYIADAQEAFLKGEAARPRPLSMSEASEELDISLSSLSRLLRQKYADTPVGIFPLRFFFPQSVGGSSQFSTSEIGDLIAQLVAEEPPERPYSDEDLARMLHARYGVRLSRRSVALYRKRAGIPSSKARKKKKSS
jgi:RNA polymerase sigma-54 factor